MRFLYVTDLHGDIAKYEQILDIALKENINLIVNGGDMLSKHGNRWEDQPTFINEYLKEYFDKLTKHNIMYLTMLGNDDLLSMDKRFDQLCDKYDNIYNIAQQKIHINGYDFIGMNYITDHPFGYKDRVVMEDDYNFQEQFHDPVFLSNDEDVDYIYNWKEYLKTNLPNMRDVLNDLPIPSDYSKTIYITHIPPANLELGMLKSQDLDIGSVEVYNFIKKHQPLLTLHGHIHEAPETKAGTWINTIDSSTCINPGQTEYQDNTLLYAYIDLENKH